MKEYQYPEKTPTYKTVKSHMNMVKVDVTIIEVM
jgi:hypothetical protein